MSRALIIGQARDLWGDRWDVRESRATEHGFSLLLGWPEGKRGYGYGGPRLICTQELHDYFVEHALDNHGEIYALPVGRTTIHRVRALMGFNFYRTSAEWWEDRIADLSDLSGAEFSRRHGASQETVCMWRQRLLGSKRQKEPFWWRLDPARAMLASDLPRAFIAERLDISVGAVGRLRWVVRREGGYENQK